MQKPHAEPGEVCPFHQKDVSKVCHKCPLYIQLRGHNANTGQEVDEWGCALAWTPALIVENSNQQRHTTASVESFRNEMVQQNETQTRALIVATSLAKKGLIEG